jgi:hypothetical protein
LGERQKNELIKTNDRIIGALYVQPYTYQQLWGATKIHRNTLKLRLDQLVKDDIIIKHHYTFGNYRGKYTGLEFYLLNWAKKQSRGVMGSIFDKQFTRGPVYIVNSNISRLSYEINSIHVEPSKREYTIIRSGTVYTPYGHLLNHDEFIEKIRELRIKERCIFERLKSYIAMAEPVEGRNDLIEKRDSLLESLILLCTRFCVYKHVERNSDLCSYDMLVFFATKGLFDYSRPYVKFWEIMQRVGY